jgi:hypothetical protein
MSLNIRFVMAATLCVCFQDLRAVEPIGSAPEKPRIRISPETTRVTGPVNAQGYVDYVAAANARAREGITNDNNAFVLLLNVLGPAENRLDIMHHLCDELGVPRIPAEGEYISGYDALGPSSPNANGKPTNPLWNEFDQAQNRPWTTDEFPAIAELMGRNDRPLAIVAEAVQRPKYYRPMVRGNHPDALMFEMLLPDVQRQREIARVLRARAMWHLGEGRIDDAERDLLTLHRLASHLGHGQFLIERLVGLACEAVACAGDRQLIVHSQFNAARAHAYREQLLALPETPQMVDSIDSSERYGALDIVQAMAQGRTIDDLHQVLALPAPAPGSSESTPTINWSRFAQAALVLSVDWNVTMSEMNRYYDEFVAAAKQPTHLQRIAAIKSQEEDLVATRQASTSAVGIVRTVFGSNRQRGKTMSHILGSLVLPAFGAAMTAQENGVTWRQLSIIGTALREYRELHGRYPESLDKLVPELLPEVPLDRFTLQPLQYRATETTFLLYSVGANGVDDGGKLGPNGTDDRAFSDPPPVE